jgi:hypothetical protein
MGPRWKRQSANTATATSTLKQVHNNNGNSENISTRKSSEKTCKSRCVDGRCCFDTQNCEVPSDITCSDYKGCLVVYAVDNDGEGTAGTAVETQAPESGGGTSDGGSQLYDAIMTACEVQNDPEDCKSLCVDGRCCFDTQNCEVPSDITCSDYEGCLVVYAVDNDDDGTSATGVETQAPESPSHRGNSNELGSLSTVIMAACEEGGDMQKGDEVCSAGQCCFPSRNCQVPSVITCEDYSGCSVLYSMDGGR